MSPLSRLSLTPRRAIFSFAKKSIWPLPPNSGPTIPQPELVDEEICPGYNSADFYPAKPGVVLSKKFQLLAKVGWGSQSTVWLARDISRFKWQSSLKIINSNNSDNARHEKEVESHITHHNPEHRGRVILRTCMDNFEVTGPEGKHMCLVYESMRDPFWIFQKRFIDRKYLKLGNILMSFEDESVLENFINQQQPMQYKTDGESGRTIYRCHNDFGPLDASKIKNMIPQLVDFGLATRLDKSSTRNGMVGEQLDIYLIQPDYYRAPEVILGCGWDFKADIWNFGVLVTPL